MKNDRPDLFSNFDVASYCQLNNNPQTMVMGEKGLKTTINRAVEIQPSEKEIIIALGFIATLLLFITMQLYGCLNIKSVKTKTITAQKTLIFKTKALAKEIPVEKLDWQSKQREIEILMLKNTISQGKF